MNYKILLLSIMVLSFFYSCKKDDATARSTNYYKSVKIGKQVWMKKNLDIDHYRNGDLIPEVKNDKEWANIKTGAWCYCYNDPKKGAIFGKLYNWYAVNDPRGLAPKGWHVPTDAEWKELEMFLGMTQTEADKSDYRGTDEGGKLKEAGTIHWSYPDWGATNESGFSAIPGGFRYYLHGTFGVLSSNAYWWSSTELNSATAWSRFLYNEDAGIVRNSGYKGNGYSVRCVRD